MDYTKNLKETLESIDITGIDNIQFNIQNGKSFIVKTNNIKRLAVYISENKGKRDFLPGELNDIFDFVSTNITTDIPEEARKIISEKIKLFCINGGEMKFTYHQLENLDNFWITPLNIFMNKRFPIDIDKSLLRINNNKSLAVSLLVPWSCLAFASLFLYDSPKPSSYTDQLFINIWIYPFIIAISIICSTISLSTRHIRTAVLFSYMPFINILYTVILLSLI